MKRITIASVIGFSTQLMNWGGCFECENKNKVDSLKKNLDDLRKKNLDDFEKQKKSLNFLADRRNYVSSLVDQDLKLYNDLVFKGRLMCYCLSGRMFMDGMTDEINEKYKLIITNNSLDDKTRLGQTIELLSSYIQKAFEAEKKAGKHVEEPSKKLHTTVYVKPIHSKEFDYTYFSAFVCIGYSEVASKFFKEDLGYMGFPI